MTPELRHLSDDDPTYTTQIDPFRPADLNAQSEESTMPVLLALASSGRVTKPPDLVHLGLIDEDTGRQLLAYFYTNCNDYVLIYDVHHDTWDKLRSAPPILLASILAIASAAQDGLGPLSETQRSSMTVARGLLLMTIFGKRVSAVITGRFAVDLG